MKPVTDMTSDKLITAKALADYTDRNLAVNYSPRSHTHTMSDITDLDISGIDIDTSNLAPKEHTHTSADISDKVNECIYEEKASFEVLGVEDNVIWVEPEPVVTGVWVGQYMVCINDSLSFTVHYTRESCQVYTRYVS